MYPNSKLNCLAHVAMTIMITVTTSTTTMTMMTATTISHTNTTNTTLSVAAASAASSDVKTSTAVFARTSTSTATAAAASLSETSAVQLTNRKTTGTGFYISTNRTRVASFTTKITPAAAAASKPTITTTTTTTTTASKNNTITISATTISHQNTTKNKKLSHVRERASQTKTKPTEYTIHSKATSNVSTLTNGTSTIISGSNTVTKKSSLLDNIVNQVGDPGRVVYAATAGTSHVDTKSNGGTGTVRTLLAKRDSAGSLASNTQPLQPEASTSSNGLDTFKNTSQAAVQQDTDRFGPLRPTPATTPSLSSPWRQTSPLRRRQLTDVVKALPQPSDKRSKNSSQAVESDTDHSGPRWPTTATSPSLSSSWAQTSPLRRRQFRDPKKALPQPSDKRSKKHSTDNGGIYSTTTGIVSGKVRTKRSTLPTKESLIDPKTEPWTQSELPSEFERIKHDLKAAPSFQKIPTAIKVGREKQLKFRRDQGKGNYQKDYKLRMEDSQLKSNILHASSYLINPKTRSQESSVNQKSFVSAITSTPLDYLPWKACHFCRWINRQKRWRAFLKSQYRKKRKRRTLPLVASTMEFSHPAKTRLENLDYNQAIEEIPLSVGLSKETDDDVIPRGIELSRTKNDTDFFDRSSEKVPLPLDRGQKETGPFQVISTHLSKGKPENISLVDGYQTESEIHIKVNFTNNTNMAVLVSSGQNIEDPNSINTSSDIDKTFHTESVGAKDRNCNNKKLCSVSRPEPLERLKPTILKPTPSLIRTSFKFLEARHKGRHNHISNDDRSKNNSNSLGLTSTKLTQGKSFGRGTPTPKIDLNAGHTTTNKTDDEQNSGILLKTFANKNGPKVPFGGSDVLKESLNDELYLLIDNSSVDITNSENLRLQNSERLLLKLSDDKLNSMKESDSLPKEISSEDFGQTKNRHPLKDTDTHFNTINTDHEDRDHDNGHPMKILIEKHDDVFTGNKEADSSVVDKQRDEDNDHQWDEEEDQRKVFNDDEEDEEDFWDRPVQPNAQRREHERKEREHSWLRNAFESVSYRLSHDFFLDPELEQKRLERKVLGRWRNQPGSNNGQQRDLATSTHIKHIYLPLQNTHHPQRIYPSAISDHEISNALQFGRIEGQPLSRIKRSTDGKFAEPVGAEPVSDEDNEKPCGNHGGHRSHVGGMHHLTRHQRRDIYRAPRTRHRYPRDVRFPSASQTYPGDAFGRAAYFSGVRELMHLRVKKRIGLAQELIPRQHFTIELWIKPDGGQSNPTVILGLFDICHQDHKAKGWNIGIRTYEEGQEEDARIYFSLETDRASSPSVLMSDRTYEPNRWVHVAASYTGKKMKLYINTALVGVQNIQTGDIFSVSASSCKEIFLGGKPYSKENLYRGSVDQILLWNFPLKHGDVVQNMFDARLNMDREKGIVFKENFDDLSQWKASLKGQPELHFSNIEDYRYDIQLVAPPCGKTVCDDPDVIRSYVQHSELRQEKKVRYRIVNVMDNNEENPKVTKFQTVAQHRALVAAFKQYNISWELEEVKLRNTSLRHKTVLLDCLPIQIGDKHCNRECQHTQTGNDGGDCDPDEIPCDAINLGNGRCDFECNRAYYEWDRGDCCKSPFKSANSTCLDPDSPHRIYLSMDEYKTALNVNGSTHLNVYLASWSLKGLATFPWEKHVYDVLGGTVVDTNSFGQPGKMDGLIHEFGHNLGLWHVHHGISEVKCDDPCMESEPSLDLGDLCSDTAPTAQNTHCRDPDWTVQACGISPFKNTPYRNYMSYASGNCTNHFTPQQVARMHCYLDLVYQPWQTIMKPSPVPLPPKVVAATLDSVTFVWLPGLGDNVYGSHSECHRCTQDGALIQYASSARAPADSRKKLHWNKEEALGPPDAERCKASSLSWMQETYECKSKCYIEFMFKYNTVPQSISIWVVWKAAVGIKNVKFYFMDGSTESLGPIRAFCDMPFTANLNYTKKVKKVRIYPNNTYVGIDAIQLISTPESARICSSCRPTKYRVMRSPVFPRPVYTSDTMYTDGSVMRGVNYSYTIQVNIGNKVSGPSPALHYQHGQPFCGNGRVETNLGERCDDGNVNDGDGCTADCEVETFYRCKGTPSLCYRHDGDGICEEDEQKTSLRDCGYHTPDGYEDQWPVSAIGNPRHQLTPKCSEDVLIGAPTRFQVCKNNVELSDTWRPCNINYFDAHDYWIKVYYARPVIAVGVVIYLGSDGRTYDSPEPKFLLVQLIDTDDRVTYVEHKLLVSCHSNPIYISILHDLSRPFFRTKGVKLSLSSSNIAIGGIRLRASQHFDPITPESCSQEQFYNPRSQQCVNQTCPRKYCDQLITENANTTCTGRGEGDVCQVTCLDGYRIRNELDEVICADGVWRRADEVSCIPVDCRWPAMAHATFICPRGTTFKQTCSFRCNPPAQLQGSGSMVTCEADGRWSMVNAYCLAFCHSPIEHPNAYPASRSCQIEKAHQAGSRCKFRCEKGFHIEGMPAKRRSLHLSCKESGQWEGKKCVRVACKDIPPEFTGMFTCSESTYGGSRCILKCPTEPRAQKIKCLQKGVWSSHFKMCNFPKSAKCPIPLLIDHRVQLRNCNNRSAGSTCDVTCNSQAYQPVLPHMNGTIFDSKDRIMKLTCTGMLKWLPNPRHISCKGTCRVMSLKDGWCDSSNNRFFCAWDEGDCCASTVEGGKIRLDKPTCKSKCACKDPNAKENTNQSKK